MDIYCGCCTVLGKTKKACSNRLLLKNKKCLAIPPLPGVHEEDFILLPFISFLLPLPLRLEQQLVER